MSISKVAQGWVLTWQPPIKEPSQSALEQLDPMAPLAQTGSQASVSPYGSNSGVRPKSSAAGSWGFIYWIEYMENRNPAPLPPTWQPLASTSERSMLVKDLRAGGEYLFRIFAQRSGSSIRSAPSSQFRFLVPDNRRKPGSTQALSAGVVSGILFFIACIVIAVCAVNICNKRRKKRAQKGKSVEPPKSVANLPKTNFLTNPSKAAYVMMTCPVLESHHDIATLNTNSLMQK